MYPWILSDNLLRHGTFGVGGAPDGSNDPLYPFVLSAARWLTGDSVTVILVVQILVACVGALLLERLATRMSGDSRAGLLAALCYCFYPYLIRQSVGWTQITLVSTLLLGGCLAFARKSYVASVACLAFASLTMAMALPVAMAALALTFLRADRRTSLIAATVFVVVLVPWGVRNYRVAGTPLPSRHAQLLYAGNNPHARAMVPRHDMDLFMYAAEEQLAASRGALDQKERHRAFGSAAWAYMAEDPWRAIRIRARNAGYFFHPRIVPFAPAGPDSALVLLPDGAARTERPRVRPRAQEIAHSAAYSVIALAAVAGLYRRRRRWRDDVLLLVSLAAFTAIAALYFPTTRIRAPIDPILMAYAACAVAPALRRRSPGPCPQVFTSRTDELGL